MLQKILKLLFIIIISVICLALVAIFLPILIIAILIALLTGKFKVARLRNGYGQVNKQEYPEEEFSESQPEEEFRADEEVIDVQAVEIEEKKPELDHS